jgi:iron complex outermembrane receptor protein
LAYRLIVDHEDEDYWRNFGVHRESLVAPSLAWLGEDTQVVLAYEHREFSTRSTAAPPSAATTTRWTSRQPASGRAVQRHGRPLDLYRLEVDHELNDDWKAHFGYSWNRETYDASQVRVTAMNEKGTLTRSMDGTQGAISPTVRHRQP